MFKSQLHVSKHRKNQNMFKKKVVFRDMPFNGMKVNQFEPHEYHTQIMQDTFPEFCDI